MRWVSPEKTRPGNQTFSESSAQIQLTLLTLHFRKRVCFGWCERYLQGKLAGPFPATGTFVEDETMTRSALTALAMLLFALISQAQAQDKDKKPVKPNKPFEIGELEKKVFHVSFPAGQKATIRVKSTEDTDVDLFVEEMDGTDVVSDTDPSKDCMVEFTPLKNKTYRISVINLGPGGNSCLLTHNGKDEKVDFGKLATTKPFKIVEDGSHIINIKLEQDKWSAVWVTSEQATDVDVFVFDPDGREIAKDEHVSKDAFVSFLPKTSGMYRIEVRNLGQGDNTCTIKHTTTEEAKKDIPKKGDKGEG